MITRKEYAARRLRPPRAVLPLVLIVVVGVVCGPLATVALVRQAQTVARCERWSDDGTCDFSPSPPAMVIDELDLDAQTLCKAELAVAVKQIDFANAAGGRGYVKSVRVNGHELLDKSIYPSSAYVALNYPHCDDLFNIFPPYGNGIIGASGRKSIQDIVMTGVIETEIALGWNGPHDQLPVCSMGGFSYAGYAEINVFVEAQDKSGTYVGYITIEARAI
jgi:hypothetical protein